MATARILLIILCFTASSFAQKPGEFTEMLLDATTALYNQPQQTIRITEHVVRNSEASEEIIKAYLLQARAHYISGEYNKSVEATLEAKTRAEAEEHIDLQLEINGFGIFMLDLFGLDLAAEKYYEFTKAVIPKDELLTYSSYLDAGEAILQANDHIEHERFDDAIDFLKVAELNYEAIPEGLLVDQVRNLQLEILFETQSVDATAKALEEFLLISSNVIPNEFRQLIVLTQLGRVYFERKEYQKAIEHLERGVEIAENLGNKVYKYRLFEQLAINHLALEDSERFYSYKQNAVLLYRAMQTDEEQAVNTVFNYTSANHEGKRDLIVHRFQSNVSILGGILLLILLSWWFLKLRYRSRIDQYTKFLDYFERKQNPVELEDGEKKEIRSVNIPKETENLLIRKLERFENSVLFTKQDMSLALLAAQFETNTKYLSEVINSHKNKNFNSYINELRINYIIDKLKNDSTYLQYKISYLAEESGFSSHSSFTTVFKSVTGISPTVFIDLLSAQKKATVKEYEYAR